MSLYVYLDDLLNSYKKKYHDSYVFKIKKSYEYNYISKDEYIALLNKLTAARNDKL